MSINNRVEQLERGLAASREHADIFEKKKAFDLNGFAENINKYVDELMEGRTPDEQASLRKAWEEYLPPAAPERIDR